MPTSRNNWSTMWRIIWNVWSPYLWTYKEMFLCSEKLMQSIKVPCFHLILLTHSRSGTLASLRGSLTGCVEMVEQARAFCSHFASTERSSLASASTGGRLKPDNRQPHRGAGGRKDQSAARRLALPGHTPSCLVCHQTRCGKSYNGRFLALGKRA